MSEGRRKDFAIGFLSFSVSGTRCFSVFTAYGATKIFWRSGLKKPWSSVLLSNPIRKTTFCTSSCSALCRTLNKTTLRRLTDLRVSLRRAFWQHRTVSTRGSWRGWMSFCFFTFFRVSFCVDLDKVPQLEFGTESKTRK